MTFVSESNPILDSWGRLNEVHARELRKVCKLEGACGLCRFGYDCKRAVQMARGLNELQMRPLEPVSAELENRNMSPF